MANEAQDWVDLHRIKSELRIPVDNGDLDTVLIEHIGEAVSFAETQLDIALIDKTSFVYAYPMIPIHINEPNTGLKDITNIMAKTAEDTPYNVPMMIGENSVLEKLTPYRSSSYLFYPDSDIPDNAISLKVSYTHGIDPDGNEHIKSALILMVRESFDGVAVADKRPAWDRILDATRFAAGI